MTHPLTDAELADLERLDRESANNILYVMGGQNHVLAAARNALPRLLAMVRDQRAALAQVAESLERGQTVVLEATKARGEAERELAKWRELQWDYNDNCLVCGVWQGSGGCRADCAFDLALRKAGLQS